MVNCALDMLTLIQDMSIEQDGKRMPLAIRIGIHSGLVHAGLIGWTKMIYDMWGVSPSSRLFILFHTLFQLSFRSFFILAFFLCYFLFFYYLDTNI